MTPAMRLISAVDAAVARLDPITDQHELDLEDLTGLDELGGWNSERDDGVWIEQITAMPAGRGIGSRIMTMLCSAADDSAATILLNPWAQHEWDTGAMDQDRLERWYGKFGFVWLDPYACGNQAIAKDNLHVMVRSPDTERSRMAA